MAFLVSAIAWRPGCSSCTAPNRIMTCLRRAVRLLPHALLATIVAALAGPVVHAQTAAPPERQASGRPRVGVALGGGSARGLAHVGVLRWLEEHRIPVDVL